MIPIAAGILWASLLTLGASLGFSQDYPNKPIRIITSPAGGSSDMTARLIAQAISGPMLQPLIVDNRPIEVIVETVAKASPDGYTLLLAANNLWIGPLMQKTSYDPVSDFSPITLLTKSPSVLVVHPSVPVNSVKELIALAKARPGELNYGSTGTGGSSHLAAELFKAMAHVDIKRINYKGTPQAINALLGAEIQLSFTPAAAIAPHLKSGKLKALAVTGSAPSKLVPGISTMAASGLPGYESLAIQGIFTPAKTSMAIVSRLNQEIVRFLKTQEAKEKFSNIGVEAVGSSPDELAAMMKSEMLRMGKVIKDAGIKSE